MSQRQGASVRTYFGVNIYRKPADVAGLRWVAYAGGSWVRADTLAGVQELIRDTLTR